MWRSIVMCLWLILLGSALPATAQTHAWLERAEITQGDWAVLHIETDQLQATLDDMPLRQQFDVGGKSVKRTMEWVNGQRIQKQHLAIGLRPREQGVFTIPPLRIGQAHTKPLQLIVLPPSVQTLATSSDVFIETEVETQRPYVQQTITIKVRIYSATRLISGQLDVDAPRDAALQQIQGDRQTIENWNGKQWHVVERRFLFIPEKSGVLTLSGPRFHGMREGDMYSLIGLHAQDVAVAGMPTSFQVQPIPANAPQPWLPLQSLSLRYLRVPQQMFAGEAAEVVVELSAQGATAVQLPPLLLPDSVGLQVFPEAAQTHDDTDGQQATVRRKFTVLAAQAGHVQLSEIKIPWWDAGQGVARMAVLPAHKIEVVPGRGGEIVTETGQAHATLPMQKDNTVTPPDTAQKQTQHWYGSTWLLWLGVGVLAVFLLALGGRQMMRRRHRAAPLEKTGTQTTPATQPSLQQALASGDFGAIAAALSAEIGLPGAEMERIQAALTDPKQQTAVQRMQEARWATGDASEALEQLRHAFSHGVHLRKEGEKTTHLLPPLYPE